MPGFTTDQSLSINGVSCGIYVGPEGTDGGIREQYSETGGPAATVIFQCQWESRRQLIQGLLGNVSYSNGSISRTTPFQLPLAPGWETENVEAALFCTSIDDVEGSGWFTDTSGEDTGLIGWGGYQWAKVTAKFTRPPYDVVTEEPGLNVLGELTGYYYMTTEIKISGEVMAPPVGSLVYAGGSYKGKAIADVAGAGVIRPRQEISITRWRMPCVPLILLDQLVGSVNSAVMNISNVQYPKGSVFYLGANNKPRPDPFNAGIAQDIELAFLANGPNPDNQNVPLDWNYFMDPGGNWVPVARNQDVKPQPPVFAYADLTQLFDDTIA